MIFGRVLPPSSTSGSSEPLHWHTRMKRAYRTAQRTPGVKMSFNSSFSQLRKLTLTSSPWMSPPMTMTSNTVFPFLRSRSTSSYHHASAKAAVGKPPRRWQRRRPVAPFPDTQLAHRGGSAEAFSLLLHGQVTTSCTSKNASSHWISSA